MSIRLEIEYVDENLDKVPNVALRNVREPGEKEFPGNHLSAGINTSGNGYSILFD